MNTSLIRWITSSTIKHFDSKRSGIKMLVEGLIQEKVQNESFIELRLDGPAFSEPCNGVLNTTLVVNFLITANISKTDLYALDRLIGVVAAAFVEYGVFKLGTGPEDNNARVACMRLAELPGGEKIRVMRFGQVDKNINILQASVEGHYFAEIEENML